MLLYKCTCALDMVSHGVRCNVMSVMKKNHIHWAWWYAPLVSALGKSKGRRILSFRPAWVTYELQANLIYIASKINKIVTILRASSISHYQIIHRSYSKDAVLYTLYLSIFKITSYTLRLFCICAFLLYGFNQLWIEDIWREIHVCNFFPICQYSLNIVSRYFH